jgi:hypothetical protein
MHQASSTAQSSRPTPERQVAGEVEAKDAVGVEAALQALNVGPEGAKCCFNSAPDDAKACDQAN